MREEREGEKRGRETRECEKRERGRENMSERKRSQLAVRSSLQLQSLPQRVLYGHGIDVGVRRWLLVPSVSSAVQSAYFVVRKREIILPCFILQEPLAYPHTSPCVIVNRYKWIQNRPEMPNEWIYCTD